jgi:hypothetical protein
MMYKSFAWLEHLKQSMYYSGIIIIAEGISRKSKTEFFLDFMIVIVYMYNSLWYI